MLRQLRQLSRADRHLLAEAAVALTLARLSVRLIPFRYVHRFLVDPARLNEKARAASEETALAEAVESALRRADKLFHAPSLCLPRVMAAYVMLTRRGARAAISLGVRPDGGGPLSAHAWLSVGEASAASSRDGEFTRLMTLRPRGRGGD